RVGALGAGAQLDRAWPQVILARRAAAGHEPPVLQRAEQTEGGRLADRQLAGQLGEGPLRAVVCTGADDAQSADDGERRGGSARRAIRGTVFHNSVNVPIPAVDVKHTDHLLPDAIVLASRTVIPQTRSGRMGFSDRRRTGSASPD